MSARRPIPSQNNTNGAPSFKDAVFVSIRIIGTLFRRILRFNAALSRLVRSGIHMKNTKQAMHICAA